MYPVFELGFLFGEEDFFGDEVFEIPHFFGADVDGGDEVGSEEVGEGVGVDVVGFYFCFGDGSCFDGVDEGYVESHGVEYVVDVFPDTGGFHGHCAFFYCGEEFF